jgi:hypothetical protein
MLRGTHDVVHYRLLNDSLARPVLSVPFFLNAFCLSFFGFFCELRRLQDDIVFRIGMITLKMSTNLSIR